MSVNTEALGMSAEKVMCEISGINPGDLKRRALPDYEEQARPMLINACKMLPKIIRHVGLERGERGGQSKSTIDFYCENGETISVKTTMTQSGKVCPSECGQPGGETFKIYFGHLYEGEINYNRFKQLCLNKAHEMIPIYLEHLFDCDYLLWVYIGRIKGYKIIEKRGLPRFIWESNRFSFSKNIDNWNESCTVKYDGVSIGECQAHNHRNCYKFRFNLKNLCRVMNI